MEIEENVEKEKVDFKNLDAGDCFLDSSGDLMLKTNCEQDGVQLSNGIVYGDLCGNMVTLVNAKVRIID